MKKPTTVILILATVLVIIFLTVAAIQLVSTARASIAARPAPVELGYIKPWSVHPKNRAAFRANPLEVV